MPRLYLLVLLLLASRSFTSAGEDFVWPGQRLWFGIKHPSTTIPIATTVILNSAR